MGCCDAVRDKIKRGRSRGSGTILCVMRLADTSSRVTNSKAMIGCTSNGSCKVCWTSTTRVEAVLRLLTGVIIGHVVLASASTCDVSIL